MGQLRTKSWDVYAHRPRLDCCLYPAFFISLVGPWRPFIPMTGILDLPFLCNRRSAWPFYTCALPRINIDSSPSSVVYFSLPWSLRRLWVNIASLIKKIVYSFVRLLWSDDQAKKILLLYSFPAIVMLILPDFLSTCTNRRGWVSLPSTTVPGDSM